MSMNLTLTAYRDVVVVKTGEKTKQTERIELWQTPTQVTHRILESKDPKQAYFDWVRSICGEEDYCNQELKNLQEEMECLERLGYEFEWGMM